MPAGVLRVYQADSKGGVQFVGEDRIGHTPKDETLNVKIGNAFDVVAERKQIDFEKIASNVFEVEYEITLRNHKTTPVAVEVNEPIGGTWRILRSSHALQNRVGHRNPELVLHEFGIPYADQRPNPCHHRNAAVLDAP